MTRSKISLHRDYIKTLARREDYLRENIAAPGGEALYYAQHEANALKWAIDVCSQYLKLLEARHEQERKAGVS